MATKKTKPSGWLILAYKVPPEPTKARVAVWRRIRGLGAVYLQSGVCILPASADHARELRIVQAEIEHAVGEALLFESPCLDARQETALIGRFKHDRDQDYEEFLDKCQDYKKEIDKEVQADHYTFAELKENDEDLKKMRNWLERIKVLDFYGAPARVTAEHELGECEALLDSYAQEVFEREQGARGSQPTPPHGVPSAYDGPPTPIRKPTTRAPRTRAPKTGARQVRGRRRPAK